MSRSSRVVTCDMSDAFTATTICSAVQPLVNMASRVAVSIIYAVSLTASVGAGTATLPSDPNTSNVCPGFNSASVLA